MLALPTASCRPGSSVKRPWGRVRRLLPLGNFFFAITWISLIVSIVFFIVAWVTVVPDALFVNNRVPLNTTGVSVHPHRDRWNPLLTVSIVVAIDTRALLSARSSLPSHRVASRRSLRPHCSRGHKARTGRSPATSLC